MLYNFEYNKTLCFDLISSIKDPEFNKSLYDLKVININDIHINTNNKNKKINIIIYWKPTITICSFASQIGLSIYLMLYKNFPNFRLFKFKILIKDGNHDNYILLNKQINDKERIKAALENKSLFKFINNWIEYNYN